ncbi:MAG TPA: hypothetical protein PL151_05135 [Phycisphaerae bacterium]|mgnify:FL=1|nr:hypothetical protein [Phycisphaerae bacterium]HOJ74788.1 hypothetical protein [Phycisphaerae bacterium]HOM51951.1 hypothetical protein [Phycisphaerae bacterium]HON67496.1 hypothetical protein [Phycisphaerae bacterium]HPP27425.1 hypothetical protein [Phycisphaerae bacterium]
MLDSLPDACGHFLAQATANEAQEKAWEWLDLVRNLITQVPRNVWILIIVVGVTWIVLRKIWSSVWRRIRLSRPPRIHPALQRYNVDRAEVQRKQRELAAGIVATSTSNRLAGYRLVRQVEAVFVEGFASPEDALVALKASAVERGANAILNVRTEHTAAGRCTASGDAVIVSPLPVASVRASGAAREAE